MAHPGARAHARAVEEENKHTAAVATGVVGAAAAAAACVQAKKKRDSAAVVELYNTIVDLPDPTDLTPQAVDDVGSKYGMKLQVRARGRGWGQHRGAA